MQLLFSFFLAPDFPHFSPPVDPGEGGLGEAVGQVGEEAPHGRSLDDEEALFSPEGKKNLYKLPPEEAKKELRCVQSSSMRWHQSYCACYHC